MEKGKKTIISLTIIMILIILGIGVYSITIYKPVKEQEEKEVAKNEVVSVVILDINPSIKLELDKDNKIVNIVALNEDAKDIVPTDLEGKDFSDAVTKITDNLVEKGYTKEEVVILVNVSGQVDKKNVESIITETFTEKKVKVSIIEQEVTENSKENAEKYNISESKAAYIEEVLKERENLTFEELKDKSIEEIEEIKNYKEPEPTPSLSPSSSSKPKVSEEQRKGTTSYKCDSVKEVMTREEARDKAIADINITDENRKRNSTFGAQITGSEYNKICSWEVIISYNKIMYYYYFDYVTGEQIGKVENHVVVADYYDAQEFAKKYMNETHGANPDEIQFRGTSGTITDTYLKFIVAYNNNKYTFEVNRKDGIVRNLVITEDDGMS